LCARASVDGRVCLADARRAAAGDGAPLRQPLHHRQPQEGDHTADWLSDARECDCAAGRRRNLRRSAARRGRRLPRRADGIPRDANLHLPDPRNFRHARRRTAHTVEALILILLWGPPLIASITAIVVRPFSATVARASVGLAAIPLL